MRARAILVLIGAAATLASIAARLAGARRTDDEPETLLDLTDEDLAADHARQTQLRDALAAVHAEFVPRVRTMRGDW